jgi:hypothetical protein
MPKAIFTVGPVLSFRGIKGDQWQVTAVVGIRKGSKIPTLHVEGRVCPVPRVLLATTKETILRYDLSCDLGHQERVVQYGIAENGPDWEFSIPGREYAPRIAYVSCNGYTDSSGLRKLARPEYAVWADLLCNHDSALRPNGYVLDKEQLWHESRIHDKGLKRFHLLSMGGDQIYFDSIWEDIKALKLWVGLSRKAQLEFKVSSTLEKEIEAYYLELYSTRWLPEARRDWGREHNLDAADAMARIPTVMMWDDHDIFDGWGSYSPAMQNCPLFQVLIRHARRAFWVFQMQHALEDLPQLEALKRANVSIQDPQFEPIHWSEQLKGDPQALPLLDSQPGFSFGHHLGPLSLFVADLRTERSRTQIMGSYTWTAFQQWLNTLQAGEPKHPGSKCQHLILMSSVPVAHPKLSLAEGLLDTFGQDHVLDSNADDLKDHWSHGDHEGERKRLLETLTNIAEDRLLRVSIASGDVHVAAWGSCYRRDIPPTSNWAQIQQFTSSGVVHPSLIGVAERLFLQLLNSTASKVQSIDVQHCVEMMIFPGHNRYVMPARNWMAFELDMGGEKGCKLWTTWRCETDAGFSNHLQAVHPAQL